MRDLESYIAISHPFTLPIFRGNINNIVNENGFLRAVEWIHITRFIITIITVDLDRIGF